MRKHRKVQGASALLLCLLLFSPHRDSLTPMQTPKAYAQAGVDIDLADSLLDEMKPVLKTASRPEVLGGIGGFGGLFDLSKLPGAGKGILVSSTDSCGTKVKVAVMADRHQMLGHDIVNHCCNDVAVTGARPIFFLDYFASDKLERKSYTQILQGLADACRAANVALIGGETAELPGVYYKGHYDLVGAIVGIVQHEEILSGGTIRPGDVVIGIGSSGLHTNGYSLARRVIFEKLGLGIFDTLPGYDNVLVVDALLAPHTNYAALIASIAAKYNKAGNVSTVREGNAFFGAAHITGSGLAGNSPRVLPENVDVRIDTKSWEPLPIFKVLSENSGASFDENYEVWNMGCGMTFVVAPDSADAILADIRAAGFTAWVAGDVVAGTQAVQLLR
jgi:phosphoribosylformylglycinamidine cyclo-ligase